MRRALFGTIMLLLLPTTSVSTAENALVARKELAPTGKLRFGLVEAPKPNVFFVIRGADGKPEGVTADLGNALARTLDVAIEFFVAHNSGELTDALENEQIDAAFLPVDDERKKRVDFGPFQSLFESTCLVVGSSDFKTISDLDRPGVRVVGEANTTTIRAAARTLKLATILPASSVSGALEMLRTGQADAFALGRDALVPYQKEIAGSRILDGYFHRTGIAIAVPKNRPAALAHAKAFIEQSKNSGLIRRIFDRAGLQDTAVAPSELRNTLLVSRLHCAFAILAMLRNARLATLNGSDGIASR